MHEKTSLTYCMTAFTFTFSIMQCTCTYWLVCCTAFMGNSLIAVKALIYWNWNILEGNSFIRGDSYIKYTRVLYDSCHFHFQHHGALDSRDCTITDAIFNVIKSVKTWEQTSCCDLSQSDIYPQTNPYTNTHPTCSVSVRLQQPPLACLVVMPLHQLSGAHSATFSLNNGYYIEHAKLI